MVFEFNLNDVPDDESCVKSGGSPDGAPDLSIGKRDPQTQKSTKRYRKRKHDEDDDGPRLPKRPKPVQNTNDAGEIAKKPPQSSIVCGVDFGTTHSGVSYRSNVDSLNNRIHTIMSWPSGFRTGQYLPKMPSRIAYKSENKYCGPGNKGLARDRVGYEVTPGMLSYTWFKLRLDDKADPTEFDDPHLRSTVGQGALKLPPGKSAAEVTGDFLRHLLKTTMEELAKPIGQDVLNKTAINFWITVPAIWNDLAQTETKKALKLAGFYERGIDKINFVSEPEAAAACALKQSFEKSTELLKKNMHITTVDIGGGTVDVESHKVEKIRPLKLKSIGKGEGGKCGSTTIDRAFMAHMIQVFGKSFLTIPETKRGPGSKFMNDFEAEKKAFRGDVEESYRIAFPALDQQLKLDGNLPKSFDEEDGEVVLDRNDMVNFFSKTINQVCSLILRQFTKVKELEGVALDAIVLAGGLAGSDYLMEEVRAFCEDKFGSGIKLLRPDDAWGAISHGAVEFGLDRTMVISRTARRWYCMVAQRDFQEGIDPEDRAVMCPIHGKRVRGRLTTLLAKGAEVKENRQNYTHGYIVIDDSKPEAMQYSYDIICSNADTEPQWRNDVGCYVIGKLKIDLKPVTRRWAIKGHYNHDASKEPVKVRFNIVTTGGHGAGIMHIAANADRKKVGEMIMDCSA